MIRNCLIGLTLGAGVAGTLCAQTPPPAGEILTPAPAAEPKIHSPSVYGQRPGRPFLYAIPATGDRPMTFGAEGLPSGLSLDEKSGIITGKTPDAGEYVVTLHAKNDRGEATKALKIIAGEKIALTPPMGWNSWNCWAGAVDQEKVLKSAHAMVSSGLSQHGWSYINIDDTWQGKRSGPNTPLLANEKFPDMKALCDQIHEMGLKAGIYSTPWTTSYARYAGGSSDDENGTWTKPPAGTKPNNKGIPPFVHGKYSFAKADADQWGKWGFDYLKYDWNPNDVPHVTEMADALRDSGRDVVFSLSNAAPFEHAGDWAKLANAWRTTGDIRDTWYSLSSIGFQQDRWNEFGGPGHYNDPDMLVVGYVGWGPKLHETSLTADEQYTHISLWSLLAAPMLIGCDLDRLDPFTIGLLSNDEVIAIDQDALVKPAKLVWQSEETVTITRPATQPTTNSSTHTKPKTQVWARPLEDGGVAVGLFNLGDEPAKVTAKFGDLKIHGKKTVRDVWRQNDIGPAQEQYEATVNPHGVVLIKLHD